MAASNTNSATPPSYGGAQSDDQAAQGSSTTPSPSNPAPTNSAGQNQTDTSNNTDGSGDQAPTGDQGSANSGASQPANSASGDTGSGSQSASSGGGAPANSGSDNSANSGGAPAADSGSGSASNSGGTQSADSGSGTAPNSGAGQPAGSNAGTGGGSPFALAGTNAPLQPVFNVANAAVDDLTGSSGVLHDAVNVAAVAGVGAIGADPSADGHSNLITDVVNLPGEALNGNLNGGVSHIAADLNDTGHAAGQLTGDVTGALGGINGLTDGIGGNDLVHSANGLVDNIANDLQSGPIASVDGTGTSGGLFGGSFGDLNGSSSSGGAIHAEAGPQSDDGLGVGVLSSSDTSHTAGIDALDMGPGGPQIADVSIASDPSVAGIPSLGGSSVPSLNGIGSSGLFSNDSTLLTVNGGNNAGDGGLTGASIGDLNGSSSGHHLIDLDAGPGGNTTTGFDILAAPTGSDNTANLNVLDVGQDVPQLLDGGIGTNPDSLNFPSLNGAGIDGLAGGLPDVTVGTGVVDSPSLAPDAINTSSLQDLVPVSITGDHGILDAQGTHII